MLGTSPCTSARLDPPATEVIPLIDKSLAYGEVYCAEHPGKIDCALLAREYLDTTRWFTGPHEDAARTSKHLDRALELGTQSCDAGRADAARC